MVTRPTLSLTVYIIPRACTQILCALYIYVYVPAVLGTLTRRKHDSAMLETCTRTHAHIINNVSISHKFARIRIEIDEPQEMAAEKEEREEKKK